MVLSASVQRTALRILCRALAAVLCAAPAAARAAPDADEAPAERWYAVYQSGRKIGHERAVTRRLETPGGAVFVTERRAEIEMLRGRTAVRSVRFVSATEDAQGRLVSFSREEVTGGLARASRGEVRGETLHLTFVTGQSATTRELPAPRGLCPRAVERRMAAAGFESGTRYTIVTFDPEHPARDVKLTVTVGEGAPASEGAPALHRLDVTSEIAPGLTSATWVDGEGGTWRERLAMGVIVFETRRTDRAAALAPNDPPDTVAEFMVGTDGPIERARRLESLTVLLVPLEPGAHVSDVPADAFQRVLRRGQGVEVSIRRAHPSPDGSYRLPYTGKQHAALLGPTVWLETDNPLVAEMAREAVGEERDALAAALRIERHVRRTIEERDLSVTMATAAETASRRAGDCTEHTMLVAAMARAAGIPSRAVAGLVYARSGTDAGFLFHMWPEVYVGEWLPLDSALYGHDATHLTLARSALAELDLPGMTAVVNAFLGKVRIEILAASHEPVAPMPEPRD